MTKKVLFSTRLKQLVAVIFLLTASVVNAQVPTITSFSPASAEVGTSVTITGTNFDATPANNIVYFGSVKATVTVATTTQLSVTVPSGTQDGLITVIVNGRSRESKLAFVTKNNSLSSLTVNANSFGPSVSISSIASSSEGQWYSNDNFLASADFDGDGKIDAARLGTNSVRVHRNTSTVGVLNAQSFDAGLSFSLRNDTHTSLIAKDINNDGLMDLIALTTNYVSFLINNTAPGGPISFSTRQEVQINDYKYTLRVADFDGDGLFDLIVQINYTEAVNNSTWRSVIYRNTTSGNTLSFTNGLELFTNQGSRDLLVSDINGDGLPDILESAGGKMRINTSTPGSISFNSFNFNVGSDIVTSFDLDEDGDNDLVTGTGRIYVNNITNPSSVSASNFTTIDLTASATGGKGDKLSYGDFNGDGKIDFLVNQNYSENLEFFLNNYSSSVTTSSFSKLSKSSFGSGNAEIVDIDGDGAKDVIFANSSGSNLILSQNRMLYQPTISVSGTLSAFSKCSSSSASNSQQINISGSNLTANISIAALTGYEYSTDGNTWASTLSLIQSSGTVSSTVYVRMTAASTGAPSGNIALSSTGATTVNVAVSGSVGTNNVYVGALSFDGVNDRVTVADNNALDLTTNYTMEAWIYPRAFNWLGGIFSKYHSNNANGYHLRLSHVGNSRGLSFDEMVTADNILNLNTWYHVAAVNINGTRKLYVNGVEVALSGSPTTVQANTDPLVIGKDFNSESTGRFFNGDIDEVRLWNFAKTQSQVVSQKDISLTGNEPNLVLYYNFNEGTPGGTNTSITTVSNIASGSYTGTLSGFALSGSTSNFVESTNRPVIGGSSSLCLGSPLQLTHSVSGGTWSIPATTGLSISNTGVLTGTTSTTATSVVVSYLYTYNGCQFTDTKTITIGQLTAGTAIGNQILCSTVAPTAITLAGNSSGSTIQWQSSLDNTTFSNISNATSASLSPGSLSSTTYYRAAVTTAACGTLYSNVITKGYNNSLSFDGTNDFVEIPDNNALDLSSAFTIEAWVFPTESGATRGQMIIGKVDDTQNGASADMAYSLRFGTNGFRAEIGNGTVYAVKESGIQNVKLNQWQHVSLVFDGSAGSLNLYLDGVVQGSAITTGFSAVKNSYSSLKLGAYSTTFGQYFKGTLDDVRIWNTARTAQEIIDNMSASLNGNETGLTANYTFNQGIPSGSNNSISSVLNSSTTASLNGTLTNFAKTGTTSNFVGGFSAVIATQPVAPTAVCLNASSNTISVTAYGSGITYQWYTNTANSTTGATAIANATTNSYVIPTNVAGTKYYYVVVTGTCGSAITSTIVAQVINNSTFTTDVSGASQNIAYGGTATALTVASPGATAYQWYSTPTKPTILDGFSGGTGWSSSTGGLQAFALYSGASPAIDSNGYLRFAYTSPSYIYKEFNLDQTATTITFSTEYASLDNNNDRGKIQLYFYNASNTQVGSVVESATLTGSSVWQSIALNNTAIPTGATKVRVVFYQIQEYPYWAGNYGIAFRNPSVTTNVALNGTLINGATAASYTPLTTTPGALYYYAVASGGCSTATSSLSGLITVAKANPTIASMVAISKTVGDAAFTITAPTSNSTGAFTFTSSNTAVASISGTTVTVVGAGTATITATQATDANYLAGSTSTTITVAKATPVLSNFDAISKTTDDAAFTLTAPTSSGGTGLVTYSSSNSAVATIVGNTVTLTGSGVTTITATKAADTNYNSQTISAQLTVGVGTTQTPILTHPVSNLTGATTFRVNYTLPEAPLSGSVKLTFVRTNGGSPIVWTLSNATSVDFNYTVTTQPNSIYVVSGTALPYGTYNVTLSYQDRFASPVAASLTNTNIQTLAPPSISIPANSYSGIVNTVFTTISVTSTGGAVSSYAITPNLPAGLTLNTTTGAISGTPTAALASTVFTITATNLAGTASTSFGLFIDADTDGDGVPDSVEVLQGTNPNEPGDALDTDGDGVPDFIEEAQGTNPTTPGDALDTDGDGVPDYIEEAQGTNPTTPGDALDTDGDGVPDYIEEVQGTNPTTPGDAIDTDGDGVPDFIEIRQGTNPTTPGARDTDGDGLPDYYESNNFPPTDISLTASSISENNVINAVIGNIANLDLGDVFATTYTLVSGTGSTDNASFSIAGNQLKAGIAFDYETKSSYSIRVKTTDAGGLSFEKAFTITVTNVNETPILSVSQTTNLGVVGIPLTTITVTNTSGPATSFAITPALSAGLTFNTATGAISGTPTVAMASRTYTISGTNSDGTGTVSFTLFIDQDTDRDGLLDSIDTDDDGDGILDRNDAFPLNKNEWTDSDRDGTGDNADTDDDNDGILDGCDVDVNGDSIPDNGTDLDSDGINDGCDTDKDGDGVNNTSDNCPNLPNSNQADRDRDGLGDSCDTVELDVTQALTPNGDGINDTWVIYNLGNHPGSIVRVFNANGVQVFYSANYQNNWTGNYEGRNEMLPVGSYLYQIDLGGDGSIDSQGWLYITK